MTNNLRLNYSHIKIISRTGFLILFSLILYSFACNAQSVGLNTLEAKFDQFRKNDLSEKLFVHTNKDFYIAGETIWFRIYDINGSSNKPFLFSKVTYVELLDKNGMPVLQTKVGLGDNENGGSITLPLTINTGNYLLRAYTSWMKNYPAGYYFEKPLTIVNTTRDADFPIVDDTVKYEVNFFPEGGNLVMGIQSTVAFHVTDQYGDGIDFKGVIVNAENDTIIRFHPFKFGMGRFDFIPEQHDYKAIIQLENGKKIIKDLPRIYDTGVVMHVFAVEEDKVGISVETNRATAKYVYLIIHTRQSVKTAALLALKDGKANYDVERSKLGDGITQITVFDDGEQPVCERLYFKRPGKSLRINLETNQSIYNKRKRVEVGINSYDDRGESLQADMSVSVYRIDSLQNSTGEDIYSYLWLTSELKGHIQSPGYYFNNKGKEVQEAMDNLMLTQGWRRFSWKDVIQNKLPVFQYSPEVYGPVVSGRITNARTGFGKEDVIAYAALPGKQARLYTSMSDSDGMVHFDIKDFYGRGRIVLETNTQTKDTLNEINILSPFSEVPSEMPRPSFKIDSEWAYQLKNYNLWMQVQAAYHGLPLDKKKIKGVDTLGFYGRPSKIYWLDSYTRYVTMEEVMREYIQEVSVRKSRNHYRLMVVNALFNFDPSLSANLFQDNPLVLLDGVPVFDVDKIMAFDPLKVERIEVVAGRYFLGPLVADGIISYTTYKGNMDGFPLDPKAIILDYEGLQHKREFYNPVYENDNKEKSRIPDFRNALYWSPNIHSDSHGLAQCTFYTSDLPGRYLIVVHGITKDGYAGSAYYRFEVSDE